MTTEVLKLTEVLSTDADKYTIHNTGLREIEGRLVRAKSKTNGGPPSSPANGDVYIVDVASGNWSSFTVGNIAHYYGGAWTQVLPGEGWRLWINNVDREHIYNGSDWNIYNLNSGTATSATAISIIDNTVNAFQVVEGVNEYIGINTTNGSETLDLATNGATVNITGVTAHTENVSVTKSTNGAIKIDLSNVNTGTSTNTQLRFTNDNTNYASINLTGINYSTTASWTDSMVIHAPSAISGGIKIAAAAGGVKISTGGAETSDLVVTASGNVGIGTSAPTSGFKLEVLGVARVGDTVGDSALEFGWSAGAGVAFLQAYNRNTSLFKDILLNNALTIKDNGNVIINDSGAISSGKLTVGGHVTCTNGGVDGTYSTVLAGTYNSNDTEVNTLSSTVSSTAANSGWKFAVSDGGGVSTVTDVLRINRDAVRILTGGLIINGGDTLADYDEGTWTPIVVDSSFSGSEGVTYSVQVGTYTRTGDEVHIQGRIVLTGIGTLTTGDPVYVAGLPFTAENVSSSRTGINIHAATGLTLGAAGQCVTGRIVENTSYIDLQVWDNSAGTTSMLVSELSAAGDIVFSGNYKV